MAEPEEPERNSNSFGEELKREREIRGISLVEIADATKISKRFLEALEKNDFRTLPAPVFTRGFVREYARYLGLNAEEMLTRYGQFASSHEGADDPQPLLSSKFTYHSRERSGSTMWLWMLGVLLVLMAVAAAVFFYRSRPSPGASESLNRARANQPGASVSPLAAGEGLGFARPSSSMSAVPSL